MRACEFASSDRAASTSATSAGTGSIWPMAARNAVTIPPPMRTVSTRPARCVSTAILSDTLAPPITATTGLCGCSRHAPSISSSRAINRPATDGRNLVTPAVEAWARCAAPKASLTNTSPRTDSLRANPGSFASSRLLNRRFSSKATPPGSRESITFSGTLPAGPRASTTSIPSSSDSRLRTGASRNISSTSPPGRPKWEHSITRAPRSRRYAMVGKTARIRESSDIRVVPGDIGTLKSTRTSTRRS